MEKLICSLCDKVGPATKVDSVEAVDILAKGLFFGLCKPGVGGWALGVGSPAIEAATKDISRNTKISRNLCNFSIRICFNEVKSSLDAFFHLF